ncbi:hypothetical protein GCM10012275_62900 [Longimycelium tulufanense]|uniref:Uncharacterized protein n=1 Tax=Longimycelium tulufanense TaxID=907463 RepID=A0A8J3CES3_9PSEU|nr:hypothetical protein GCM10012275_62900 [Longimycelium tulufanense]
MLCAAVPAAGLPRATLTLLQQKAGPFQRDEAALLRAVDMLEASRAAWHVELRAYAAARREAKQRGQRAPHPTKANPYTPTRWYGTLEPSARHADHQKDLDTDDLNPTTKRPSMKITSGGMDGPRLDESLSDLDNNVYGSLTDGHTPEELARAFAQIGWRARTFSRAEYEIEYTWAQIGLFQDDDGATTFAGVVDPDRIFQRPRPGLPDRAVGFPAEDAAARTPGGGTEESTAGISPLRQETTRSPASRRGTPRSPARQDVMVRAIGQRPVASRRNAASSSRMSSPARPRPLGALG